MEWQRLLDPDIQNFISDHAHDDVSQLALKKAPDAHWPYGLILDQIKVRQKAKIKSPDLYETNGFIFPLNNTYEQASSSVCAQYKAHLVSGKNFVDLTTGSGIDAFQMSQNFTSCVLVEKDEHSAGLLEHNVSVLQGVGAVNTGIDVHPVDAHDYIQNMDSVDVAYIDPQRRENGRKGLYDFSVCSPNIIEILPVLKCKAKKILIKASPFLGIESAIEQLQAVVQVHVVQWQNECKEVLYLLDCDVEGTKADPKITAVDLDNDGNVRHKFSYFLSREKNENIICCMPKKYIYEPGPAFQKAGGFKVMAAQYGVSKIHPNSQLYTADSPCENFPGKGYEVIRNISGKGKRFSR